MFQFYVLLKVFVYLCGIIFAQIVMYNEKYCDYEL